MYCKESIALKRVIIENVLGVEMCTVLSKEWLQKAVIHSVYNLFRWYHFSLFTAHLDVLNGMQIVSFEFVDIWLWGHFKQGQTPCLVMTGRMSSSKETITITACHRHTISIDEQTVTSCHSPRNSMSTCLSALTSLIFVHSLHLAESNGLALKLGSYWNSSEQNYSERGDAKQCVFASPTLHL